MSLLEMQILVLRPEVMSHNIHVNRYIRTGWFLGTKSKQHYLEFLAKGSEVLSREAQTSLWETQMLLVS